MNFLRRISIGCVATLLSCLVLISLSTSVNALEESAIFAGGCFWCLEHDFEELQGVISVESGYSGGEIDNPSYRNHKGHQEVVRVSFNSLEISYEDLLKSYWRNIDPYDSYGQFCDRGDSYRPVIYFSDESQMSSANLSLEKVAQELSIPLNKIGVEIKPKSTFWIAEDYHQDYAERNSMKYKFYRYSCQRDKRLDEVWGENARKGIQWAK